MLAAATSFAIAARPLRGYLCRRALVMRPRFYSSAKPITGYTETHEWVRVENNIATIGVTQYAQKHLGDVVFVELPETESKVDQGEAIGSIESVKAASDVYAPADGTVLEANEALAETPALINKSPEKDGWIFKLELKDASQLKGTLKSAEEYKAFCDQEE
ncbi:hypothetical protein H4R35_004886 [Dimargaris xerosporica]|nr:hypothetical protein H4R35_004886 [Dimargaris xerosporica]